MHSISFQKQLTLFLVFFSSLLSTIFLVNLLVDPYYIYGNPLHFKKRPSDLKNKSHLIKAIQIIRNKPDTIILGSSTVDCGYALQGSLSNFDNPEYKAAHKRLLQKLGPHANIYNAGINGATLSDIFAFLKHAYKNNSHLKHVILGLEWHLFTAEMPPSNYAASIESLQKTRVPLTTLVNTTLTLKTVSDSYRTLEVNKKLLRNLAKIYQKSVNRLPSFNPKLNPAGLLEEALPLYFKPKEQQLILGQKGSETTALLLSLYYLSTLYGYFEDKGETALLNPVAFDYLQNIVNFAREKNIRLDIYITPQHGTHWATADKFGLGEYVDTWLKKIAEITPFWDFSGRIDFHAAVSDYFGGDDRHFNYQAGDIILTSILNGKSNPQAGLFFAKASNVQTLIKHRHAYQKKWLKENVYLEKIFAYKNFQKLRNKKADMQKLLVQLQPSYHNYYVFRFIDEIIALPINDAPYDFGRILRAAYPKMLEAKTAPEIMKKINASTTST